MGAHREQLLYLRPINGGAKGDGGGHAPLTTRKNILLFVIYMKKLIYSKNSYHIYSLNM